jgi:NACHT domain-containing protein
VIVLNVLSQGLWEFAISPLAGAGLGLAGYGGRGEPPAPLVAAAARATQRLAEVEVLQADLVKIEEALNRPEVRELLRELFVFNAGSQPDGVGKAREAFDLFFRDAVPSVGEGDASIVFDILLEAADGVLAAAVQDGSLSALDTRSAFRQRIVLDHVQALERRLDLLRTAPVSLSEIDAFERGLRNEATERFGNITPPDFHSAPRVPIDALYVVPSLERLTDGPSDMTQVDYRDWLEEIDRSVVLGNPGAGKSTLAKKICYDLARDDDPALLGRRVITPVIVTLKDYGADKRSHGYSVREFLEVRARASFQFEVPEGGFKYLLSTGRLLVIFDGLDELLDTSYRQEIRSDVESFGRRYPATPLIVTSREVGYSQAPLEPEVFSMIRIAEFDGDRVSEYAAKWFALDKELTPKEQSAKATSFVAESAVVHDLRSNPLLLALMCNLYRGQNYIPRNRPDVYESCARMLFEVWDKSRGIESVLPIAEHLRPAMQFLASWIYSDDSLRAGVTREQLIEKSTEFLLRWRFDDPHRARHAAAEFVDFCRGRAWVFSDLGSNESGTDLFLFTHRTFLEYFAAAYLVESHPSNSELIEVLAPHIAKQEWDVVAQVSFQLRSRAQLGAADELLEQLLALASDATVMERNSFGGFAVRALGFLVPTPKATRDVVRNAVDCAIEAIEETAESETVRFGAGSQALPGGLLRGITTISSEIADSVKDCFVEYLDEVLAGGDERAPGAARIISGLVEQVYALDEPWQEALRQLLDSRRERINSLAKQNGRLSRDLVASGLLPIGDLLSRFGAEQAFDMRVSMLGDGWFSPVAVTAAIGVMSPRAGDSERSRIAEQSENLRELGRFAKMSQLPWVTHASIGIVPAPWVVGSQTSTFDSHELDEEEWFGLFVVSATWAEFGGGNAANQGTQNRLEMLEQMTAGRGVWQKLVEALRGAEEAEIDAQSGFEDAQSQALIKSWVNGDVSFAAE